MYDVTILSTALRIPRDKLVVRSSSHFLIVWYICMLSVLLLLRVYSDGICVVAVYVKEAMQLCQTVGGRNKRDTKYLAKMTNYGA